jgi:hypothetical protein
MFVTQQFGENEAATQCVSVDIFNRQETTIKLFECMAKAVQKMAKLHGELLCL